MSNAREDHRLSDDAEYGHEGRGARSRVSRRLLKVLLLGGTVTLFTLSGVAASAQMDGTEPQSLDDAVLEEMSAHAGDASVESGQRSASTTAESGSFGGSETQVNVMRSVKSRDGTEWAFGSSVIEAPKKEGYYPQGWLFVAKNDGGGWETELEGAEEFAPLADEAPDSVVSEDESDNFEAASSTGSAGEESKMTTSSSRSPQMTTVSSGQRIGLMLPWKKNTAWYMTGGPHGWNSGYDTPYSSLDLVGRNGDQGVRAAAPGNVYTMCSSNRGWIRVYHPNGYTTDYYHLSQNIKPADGTYISRGTVLGQTGEDASCGGQAYGRHVHFSLLRGESRVAIGAKNLGGWTFRQGEAYGGYAERNGTRRYPGGNTTLTNYGSQG